MKTPPGGGNSADQLDLRLWSGAALSLALACAAAFAWWHVIDETPPRWDESHYLVGALNEYRAAQVGGPVGLFGAYMTTLTGGANQLPLLALPGFFLFGPSAKAGIAIFFLLWPIAIFGMFDLTRHATRSLLGFDEVTSLRAGFLAALLFAISPQTQYLSNYFLTEFPLITCIIVVHAAALRYMLDGRLRWGPIIGIALAAGFLAKTTFSAFLIAPAGLIVVRWLRGASPREIINFITGAALPPLIIVAPFYITNFDTIIATVRFLTSAETASVFGSAAH